MADKYNPTQFKDLMGYLTRNSEDKKRMRDYFETNDPVEFGKEVIKRVVPIDFSEVPVLENVSIGMSVPNRLEIGANFPVGGGELMIGGGMQGQDKSMGIGFRKEFDDGGRAGFKNGSPKEMVDELNRIKSKTEPLNKAEKLKLYKSYDDIFKQEYKRLLAVGDPFSKTDLNRAVINRIVFENTSINLTKGIGLDKIPGGGNEESKTLFERYDKTSARGPLFTKKELKNFTQGNQTNARVNTKAQENIFRQILNGNTNKTQLAKTLGISEGRLSYNIEKLMRNLAKGSGDQYTFLKDYKEKDLEKVRNNIYESPTLESAYQRTIVQSVLQSTELGSPERKQALNKLKEFNKFKQVMLDNGLDPKILALDHAASYRAIKNGNLKNFLAVTPVIRDINTLKSSFDRRSQLNLRRMREYLTTGDTQNYKYFLKNQTELENLWKTMTGGQSSLGKIRLKTRGPNIGDVKIFDYGATSLLDKNKNLINELAGNLSIRQNIVNASSVENLDKARRIMLEGSELTEKKMLGTLKKTDKAARTKIDQSFKDLNKPEMFKAEKQISQLLGELGCPTAKFALGGRVEFNSGGACVIKGREKLESILKKGVKVGSNEQVLAQGILKAGQGLKNAFALRGLFGPAAIALTALTEGGILGYDMLSQGKTFKEAMGDSLFNLMLGDDYRFNNDFLTKGGTFDERLDMLKFNPNQKQLIDNFRTYDSEAQALGDASINVDKAQLRVKGSPVQDIFKDGPPSILGKQFTRFVKPPTGKEKKLREDELRAAIAAKQAADQSFQTRVQDIDFAEQLQSGMTEGQDLMGKAIDLAELQQLGSVDQNIFGKIGEGDIGKEKRQERILELLPTALNFAGGGIAKQAGDSSGKPPLSGPTPQGLPGLLKRGI